MTMLAPDRTDEIPATSKERNPDCVVCGSTALAANWEDSVSSISFLVISPFTLCGRGIGLGRVLVCGFESLRYKSSVAIGVSFERLAVIRVIVMLAMETGWSPSLVTMKKTGRKPCSAKLMEKIF